MCAETRIAKTKLVRKPAKDTYACLQKLPKLLSIITFKVSVWQYFDINHTDQNMSLNGTCSVQTKLRQHCTRMLYVHIPILRNAHCLCRTSFTSIVLRCTSKFCVKFCKDLYAIYGNSCCNYYTHILCCIHQFTCHLFRSSTVYICVNKIQLGFIYKSSWGLPFFHQGNF